uniref:Uncharacterized protein n=1 Tax=Anguilla anguilla TaxID=7936 RepID=A0A0E9TJC4_ANGAN
MFKTPVQSCSSHRHELALNTFEPYEGLVSTVKDQLLYPCHRICRRTNLAIIQSRFFVFWNNGNARPN